MLFVGFSSFIEIWPHFGHLRKNSLIKNTTKMTSLRGQIVYFVNCKQIPQQANLLFLFDLLCCFGFHGQIAKTLHCSKLLRVQINLWKMFIKSDFISVQVKSKFKKCIHFLDFLKATRSFTA